MPLQLDPHTTSVPTFLEELLEPQHELLSRGEENPSIIGHSSKVSGIEIRMLPPLIKSNGKSPLIGSDLAQLYCLTIVASDLDNQLVGGIDLKGFPRIRDNEQLPINKTIFYWQADDQAKAGPNQIHFISRVIRSRQNLRDVGSIMTEAKSDSDYKGLIQNISSLLKSTSPLTAISESIFFLSSIVGKYLGKVEDKDLGTVINSFTTLHGDYDRKGIMVYNYPTTNIDFKFELVVRDSSTTEMSTRSRGIPEKNLEMEEKQKVEVDLIPF